MTEQRFCKDCKHLERYQHVSGGELMSVWYANGEHCEVAPQSIHFDPIDGPIRIRYLARVRNKDLNCQMFTPMKVRVVEVEDVSELVSDDVSKSHPWWMFWK